MKIARRLLILLVLGGAGFGLYRYVNRRPTSLTLTGIVGFGWARWSGLDVPAAAGVAPAIGVATLAIGGVALEPLGLPLSGRWGPTVVVLLAAGLGYLLLILQGKPSAPSPPPIEEQPAE